MTAGDVQVLVDGAIYTEAPRWRGGAVRYSDIGAGQACRVTLDGEKKIVLSGIATASGLGWTRSGDLLVASIEVSTVYRVGADRARHVLCGAEHRGQGPHPHHPG